MAYTQWKFAKWGSDFLGHRRSDLRGEVLHSPVGFRAYNPARIKVKPLCLVTGISSRYECHQSRLNQFRWNVNSSRSICVSGFGVGQSGRPRVCVCVRECSPWVRLWWYVFVFVNCGFWQFRLCVLDFPSLHIILLVSRYSCLIYFYFDATSL